MSPRSTSKQRQRQTTDTRQEEEADTDSKPLWDSSPNKIPAYCEALEDWLPEQDSHYADLFEYGWVLDRQKICCVNDNHIKALQDDNLTPGTIFEPVQDGVEWSLIVDGAPLEVRDAEGNDVFPRGRYADQPEVVAACQRRLLNTILSTITDRCTRDDLRKKCKGVGTTALTWFATKRKGVLSDSTTYGSRTLATIRKIEKAGIGAPRVAAFNTFRSSLTDQIKTLPDDLQRGYPPVVIARSFMRKVEKIARCARHGDDR